MWHAITEADLLKTLSGDELTAIREAALADGQSDPVDGSIADTMSFARGYIEASGNVLGAEGTVPARLIKPLCAILAVDLLSRVAGMQIDPKGARATAKASAIKTLEDVAAGSFAIDAPTEIGLDAKSAPTPSITRRSRRFRRQQQDGI